MLNQRGFMPRSFQEDPACSPSLCTLSAFFQHSQIFAADGKTGTGFLLLFSFVFPLAHNRAPGLEKSSRFVECEVKWSSIWLRPRPSLFLPAQWPGTTQTAIYWRQLNFFVCVCHRPKELFVSSEDFWVEGGVGGRGGHTPTNLHYITLFLWRIVPDRQSCSLIITKLHRARVLVLPGGLCDVSALQMHTHTHTESFGFNQIIFLGWSTNT